MQTLLPRVFMRRARDTDPLVLRDAFMLLATRPASSTDTDEWQEIAPGVRVQRAGLRWLLRHDDIGYRLSVQETAVLGALLEAHGNAVKAAALEPRLGSDGLTPARLRVLARQLREKLEDDPAHPHHLLAAHGGGYRWQH